MIRTLTFFSLNSSFPNVSSCVERLHIPAFKCVKVSNARVDGNLKCSHNNSILWVKGRILAFVCEKGSAWYSDHYIQLSVTFIYMPIYFIVIPAVFFPGISLMLNFNLCEFSFSFHTFSVTPTLSSKLSCIVLLIGDNKQTFKEGKQSVVGCKITQNNNNEGYNLDSESLCLNVHVRCKLVCANQSDEFLFSLSVFQLK